jgi:Outer membrane protein beta-barrel family/Carboxypeptidase regulatory-like domain
MFIFDVMKQLLFIAIYVQISLHGICQAPVSSGNNQGIITGELVDAMSSKPLALATVSLKRPGDTLAALSMVSAKDGSFLFENLPFGYYRLQTEMAGYNKLTIDSIYLRADRFDFNLNEIKLNKKTTQLEEVIVYAEKPLIESKDGKITFNVGESALSAGATATELLKQAPLVNVDNDGKVLLRGKETKILIDDKPVEMSARQLQDLLESMPGSSIEKIEVMTTPPPQYANERGGVINIVTKKGKVGKTARLNISYGTRGEASISGNFGYRKNKWNINATAGYGYSRFTGNSYSTRQNIYTDSVNYFNTNGQSNNLNNRPNARFTVDYEADKKNSLNLTLLANSNIADNNSHTAYASINSNNQPYRLSNRLIASDASSISPGANFTWTRKFAMPGEVLKIITGVNLNANENERDFYQQFLNPDLSFSGIDSTQQQRTRVRNHTVSLRVNYDKPLKDKKTTLNVGTNASRYNSHNTLNTLFMKKPENVLVLNSLLSNDFFFHQTIAAVRAAVRYNFAKDFYVNAGVQTEFTSTSFELKDNTNDFANTYTAWLPFSTLHKKWPDEVSATISYKRTIQRPGLNELNPSVDYADPYNTRFGNPYLLPYYADNFDFILGKWNKAWYINGSVGYNALQDIYSSIRTLQPDGKTTISWQNISGRREYEASAWGGLTLSKKSKVNISFGYTYNVYSNHDRAVNRFRNGGSFYSTLNGNYQFTELLGSNANFTFNRFANPQGSVRNTLSMNLGVQRKFLQKRLTVSINIIDPLRQQQNRNFTYGSNFNLESFSATQTRNFRIAVGYNLIKPPVTKVKKQLKQQKKLNPQ